LGGLAIGRVNDRVITNPMIARRTRWAPDTEVLLTLTSTYDKVATFSMRRIFFFQARTERRRDSGLGTAGVSRSRA
jgi:hypothetical protein